MSFPIWSTPEEFDAYLHRTQDDFADILENCIQLKRADLLEHLLKSSRISGKKDAETLEALFQALILVINKKGPECIDLAKILIEGEAPLTPHSGDKTQNSALWQTIRISPAFKEQVPLLNLLVSHGGDPNEVFISDITPIEEAAILNNEKLFEALLQHKVKLRNPNLLLLQVTTSGHTNLLKQLLEYGVGDTILKERMGLIFEYLTLSEKFLKTHKPKNFNKKIADIQKTKAFLIDNGYLNHLSERYRNALLRGKTLKEAIQNEDFETVTIFFENNHGSSYPTPSFRLWQDGTMQDARFVDQVEEVQSLANLASRNANPKILNEIIQNNKDKKINLEECLLEALETFHPTPIKNLIDRGASPNKPASSFGLTPLVHALFNATEATVRFLLSKMPKGEPIYLKEPLETLLKDLIDKKRFDIVTLLIRKNLTQSLSPNQFSALFLQLMKQNQHKERTYELLRNLLLEKFPLDILDVETVEGTIKQAIDMNDEVLLTLVMQLMTNNPQYDAKQHEQSPLLVETILSKEKHDKIIPILIQNGIGIQYLSKNSDAILEELLKRIHLSKTSLERKGLKNTISLILGAGIDCNNEKLKQEIIEQAFEMPESEKLLKIALSKGYNLFFESKSIDEVSPFYFSFNFPKRTKETVLERSKKYLRRLQAISNRIGKSPEEIVIEYPAILRDKTLQQGLIEMSVFMWNSDLLKLLLSQGVQPVQDFDILLETALNDSNDQILRLLLQSVRKDDAYVLKVINDFIPTVLKSNPGLALVFIENCIKQDISFQIGKKDIEKLVSEDNLFPVLKALIVSSKLSINPELREKMLKQAFSQRKSGMFELLLDYGFKDDLEAKSALQERLMQWALSQNDANLAAYLLNKRIALPSEATAHLDVLKIPQDMLQDKTAKIQTPVLTSADEEHLKEAEHEINNIYAKKQFFEKICNTPSELKALLEEYGGRYHTYYRDDFDWPITVSCIEKFTEAELKRLDAVSQAVPLKPKTQLNWELMQYQSGKIFLEELMDDVAEIYCRKPLAIETVNSEREWNELKKKYAQEGYEQIKFISEDPDDPYPMRLLFRGRLDEREKKALEEIEIQSKRGLISRWRLIGSRCFSPFLFLMPDYLSHIKSQYRSVP